jgi:hypothetical protein
MSTISVGSVRPSQLLWTYGPGALIDLPNLSVITMGLDRWDADRCTPIDEARLLETVRAILGPQVQRLRMPPVMAEENANPFAPESKIGIPVRPFPRWLRCVRCGLLAEVDSGLFSLKENPFRPDQTHYVHSTCEKGRDSDAVPARFLLACPEGHLDDFPWHWFVHSGPSACQGTLRFFERGASLQTENLWVKCDRCDAARSLVHAFGAEAKKSLPACRGRHPHLDKYEDGCDAEARTVLLGSTNSWFPITVSVLAIPQTGNTLDQFIQDGWQDFKDMESEGELKGLLKGFKSRGVLQGIERYSLEEIWKAIQTKKKGKEEIRQVSEGDIKLPEWSVLTHSNPPTDWPHFLSERIAPPTRFSSLITSVLLLKRLREVNALVGYTRVDAPEESASPDERPAMAALCRNRPDWVPATEVHGEGIFLRFDENAVKTWEAGAAIKLHDARLMAGHRGWRNARQLDPGAGYPGIRYAMLHTFSHLLIRELALECGYNAASIRERIYAKTDGDVPMAGVLLYTAAADSDGTLGGLIALGKPESLGRMIEQSLQRAAICSSDPLCSEHDPEKDRSLHAAACHACAFVSETSCERANRYLDRSLLIDTFASSGTAFFNPRT